MLPSRAHAPQAATAAAATKPAGIAPKAPGVRVVKVAMAVMGDLLKAAPMAAQTPAATVANVAATDPNAASARSVASARTAVHVSARTARPPPWPPRPSF